jgi:hypothetical protein
MDKSYHCTAEIIGSSEVVYDESGSLKILLDKMVLNTANRFYFRKNQSKNGRLNLFGSVEVELVQCRQAETIFCRTKLGRQVIFTLLTFLT